jgi:hypothetical protein
MSTRKRSAAWNDEATVSGTQQRGAGDGTAYPLVLAAMRSGAPGSEANGCPLPWARDPARGRHGAEGTSRRLVSESVFETKGDGDIRAWSAGAVVNIWSRSQPNQVECLVVVAIGDPLIAGEKAALLLAPLALRRRDPARLPEMEVEMNDRQAGLRSKRAREGALPGPCHASHEDAAAYPQGGIRHRRQCPSNAAPDASIGRKQQPAAG